MKQIILTLPHFFPGEAAAITRLFDNGLEWLHLRKPTATLEEVENLLRAIPMQYHPRIVTHEHFSLAEKYALKGIHLNARNPYPPTGYTGHLSRSCHSLEEVRQYKSQCDYLFLSPIYNSISKAGYKAAFSKEVLEEAHRTGLIDEKVIALGGVRKELLPEIESLGFGGAALLGDVWNATPKIILTIAGSDASGGAGIQADIKAISALGGYAASVLTAVTAQNTLGVQGIYPMSAEAVSQQIASVMDDLNVAAVKIGMVFDTEIVRTIAESLRRYQPKHVVFDPVMISTSGKKLMKEETIQAIKEELIPLATLITPNLHEASLLYDREIDSIATMEEVARTLAEQYGTSVLIKGGHLEGDAMCDILYHQDRLSHHTLPRVDSKNLHGTGCTLSSAIATLLGQDYPMVEAIDRAKTYVNRAIDAGKAMQIGGGNGPVWHFYSFFP